MKELTLLANKYKSDKGTEFDAKHCFSEIYDDYLLPLKDKQLYILEIGIDKGNSLRMWEEYFKNSKILGLDLDDKSQFNSERILCKKLDQSNQKEIEDFSINCPIKFDLIIDDGSHHMSDQQITFGNFFPLLNSEGIFIIEDLHTSLLAPGTVLYDRMIENNNVGDNTTLHFLKNIKQGSKYLSEDKNNYLIENVKDIKIHDLENNHAFGNVSITSVILKK